MNGPEQIEALRKAGFADHEIGTWTAGKRQTLTGAGFSEAEIDTYFGKPPFDPAPVIQAITAQKDKATAGTGEGTPRPVTDFLDAFEAGFGMSTSSLLAKKPTTTLSPDAPRASRIAANVGTLLGDLPTLTAGYLVGGMNPITGTAGAFGLTEGIRRVMMDKYEKGEVSSFAEFWDRAAGASIDTMKGWIVGAATGAAGKAIGALPIVSPTVKTAATLTGEVATMTTVGAALDGRVPEPDEFLDAAIVIGGVKAAGGMAGKLRNIYAETGVKPDQVVQDIMRDPTILHDVMAANKPVPDAYQAAVERPVEPPAKTADVPAPAPAPMKPQEHFLLTLRGTLALPESAKPKTLALPDLTATEPVIPERAGQQEIPVPPPTIGERPIIAREATPEEAPLFSKAAQMPEPEQAGLFTTAAEPLPIFEAAQTPRHLLQIDQNAELLARAEKALADVESAGQERGTKIFNEQSGQGGTPEIIGLKSATADWYKDATTGQKKLSRKRVEVALNKIITGKGTDTGTDVQRIKELLFQDEEFAQSPFAPRSEEEWARARQYAVTEWEPDVAMGGGAPPKAPGLPGPTATPTPPAPGGTLTLKTAQDAVLARVVREDAAKPSRTFDDVYTSVIDNLNPIRTAMKEGKTADLTTAENAYELERLTRGTMGKGIEFLKYGAFDWTSYKTVTRGYEQIMAPVKKDLDGFIAYMVSKRAIEKAGQGIETGIPLQEAELIVRQGAKKYQKVHEERLEFIDARLRYFRDSGMLSQKSYEEMKARNKDFVPFHRFFEDEPGSPSSSRSVRNPIKRMKGGEQQILDPIMSDMKDTFLLVGIAEKNAARQKYVKMGSDFAVKQAQPIQATRLTEPEIRKMFDEFLRYRKETASTKTETSTTTGGTATKEPSKQGKLVVERVREALLARNFSTGEADQMIRRVGEAEAGKVGATTEKIIKEIESTTYIPELDIRLPNEVATVFRAMQAPAKKDEIVVFTKGKREVYQVDPKVAEAFQDADRISTNFLTDMIVHTPASLLRAGVILTPDYITRNVMRDAVSSFIYAGSNPIKTALGLKSIVTKDTAYHNWLKGGGGNATMVAIDRDYIHNEIMNMGLETGLLRRSWNVAKTPLDLLRATSELIENATRVGAVRSEMMQAKTKAQIQALSLIAREATVDFSRHGRDTQEFAKATAFFNPALQGIDRFAREMKNHPVGTTAKAMAAVTLPSLLLWWANKDDKEIQDLPAWQHYAFMMTRVPLPGGGSFILRIPYAQEFGILFGSIPVKLIDAYFNDNPDAFKGFGEAMIQAFTPSLVPTVAVPILNQATNQHSLGGPIIPADREKLLPEYQYTPYTTELTKAMGQIIGAFPGMEHAAVYNKDAFIGGVARALTTPALLDNYVRSWTGGTGQYLLNLADKGLREAGVLPDPVTPAWDLADYPVIKAFVARSPSANTQSIRTFFEAHEGATKYYNTFMFLAEHGDVQAEAFMHEHADDMVKLDQMKTAITEHSAYVRMIAKNPNIPSEEQKQLIDTTYWRMIELARAGNDMIRELKAAAKQAEDDTYAPSQESREPVTAPSLDPTTGSPETLPRQFRPRTQAHPQIGP